MVNSYKMSTLYWLISAAILGLSFVSGECPQTWPGESVAICRSQVCVKDEDCVKSNTQGHCCSTKCGGRNCHFPEMLTSSLTCPESLNWTGTSLKTCYQDLCKSSRECQENGTFGVCCQTSCSGQNCFYGNGTSSAGKTKRSVPNECPFLWDGSTCNETTCHENNHCQKEGKVGFCCPTQCGKHNCYWPTEEKSDDCDESEDCHDEADDGREDRSYHYYYHYGRALEADDGRDSRHYHYYYHYGRALPSGPLVCPSNWIGIVGVCGHNLCTNDSQCSAGDLDGLCCDTKCGGHNCFVQSMPQHRADELVIDCPANWTGSNDTTCQDKKLCNKSKECVHKGDRGLCCQTTCSGRSCFFANTTSSPRIEKPKVQHVRCPKVNGWLGSMPDKCKENTCSHHANCRNSDKMGYCCPTTCGGKSCYTPGNSSR